ncbi:thioesterase domain-containing protein [Streptomyces sp. NPDC058171]
MTALSFYGDLWCCGFPPSPTATRRPVCSPHVGGSASLCVPVCAAPYGPIDRLAAQYPGMRDPREQSGVQDLHRMAGGASEELRRWDDFPLTSFRHGMGALVAFEVAPRIERAAGRIDHPSVSGSGGRGTAADGAARAARQASGPSGRSRRRGGGPGPLNSGPRCRALARPHDGGVRPQGSPAGTPTSAA